MNILLPVYKTVTIDDKIKGTFTIAIIGSKVRVLETNCPKQLCKKMGEIQYIGESIICVPNKLHIYIKSETTENEVDAYTW